MGRFTSRSLIVLVFLVCIAAGAAAAAGYALTAPKRYRATAQILVAPVSPGDPTFAGLSVLRDTGGKRTAAASVAALLRGPQIADAVASSLALHRSRSSLENALHVHVVDSSDVVDVTAEDTTGSGAAELANSFAGALITQRSAAFQSGLGAAIRRDQQLVASSPGDKAIARRLTTLKGFVGQPDPTIHVASEAATPTASSWPELWRLIGIGAAIGAGAGLLLALLLFALRGGGARRQQYDQAVSDRAAEKLAERLEARIAAREAALAARERDLQAALDEVRNAAAPVPAPAPEVDDSELRQREQALADRVAAVTKREVEVAHRAAELAVREQELGRRAQELERHEEELGERQQELTQKEEELAQAPPPAPAAPPPAARVDGHGQYSLSELEELIATRGQEHPDRLEEWESYLFFLRDYASADGRIPASFDWLIADTFADIL